MTWIWIRRNFVVAKERDAEGVARLARCLKAPRSVTTTNWRAPWFLLLLLLAAPALSQEIAWELKPSTTSALLGEPVTISGTIRHSEDRDLVLSLAASATEAFTISSAAQEPGEVRGGKRVQRFKLEILPLAVGKVPIATSWELKSQAGPKLFASPPIFLDVNEPPLDPLLRLRDIKGPRPARSLLWPWLAAAALAAGAYALLRRLRRKGSAEVREARVLDARPPDVIALSELALLESSGLWAQARHKEFYIRLTDILRRYLESRYGIPATRLTTVELARHLRHAEIDRGVSSSLKEVFDRADLVKFAKIVPPPGWGSQDLEASRALVRETTPAELAGQEARA